MNYLLDTHTMLWCLFPEGKLSSPVRKIVLQSSNTTWVSVVSVWEVALKYALRKIDLKGKLPSEFPEGIKMAGFEMLSLEPEVVGNFYKLPRFTHKDPFDRMLVWQAIEMGWPLISKDKALDVYKQNGLTRVW